MSLRRLLLSQSVPSMTVPAACRSVAVALVVALAASPGLASAWNSGTHAYIAAHLIGPHGRQNPQLMRDRLYGSNGPDVFNYAFQAPFPELADYLHEYAEPNATLRVWNTAKAGGDPELIAYARGFVSHDNAFGADATAHIDGLMGGGVKQGYVIAKAAILAQELEPLLSGAGLSPEQVALGAHVLIEASVDLLVQAQLDPQLGAKLLDAVDNADPGVGVLLAGAYRSPLAQYFPGGEAEAGATIVYVESQFRGIEHAYALALAESRPDAFEPLAGFNAQLAEALYGMPASTLYPVVVYGMQRGMELVQKDFQREMFMTILFVNWNLYRRGVVP